MATHDIELVEYFFAHTVAPAFVAVLVPAVVLVVLLSHGWPMAVALLPFLVVVGLSPFLMRRRVDELGSRAREALAELNAHAVDTIQGLTEVIAFEQTKRRRAEFVDRIRAHLQVRLPFFRDLTVQKALLEVATGLGALAVVAAAAHLSTSGDLRPEIAPLLTLARIVGVPAGLRDRPNRPPARRYSRLDAASLRGTHRAGASDRRSGGRPHRPRWHDARARALQRRVRVFSRSPSARRHQLRGADRSDGGGGGAVGRWQDHGCPSHAAFLDPSRGTVRMNGHDLREYGLEALRDRIALVSQDTYLFNETLRANILMARPTASDHELAEAVSRASLTQFVETVQDGLDTRVGERGVRLSGGQRQRVAIARAFLKDAPILILDEATSHLDAVNERAVRGALEELMVDRSTVVIAHRLSTVRNADTIVVLDGGKVVETGTHTALMRRGGLYGRLVGRQLASAAAE